MFVLRGKRGNSRDGFGRSAIFLPGYAISQLKSPGALCTINQHIG